MAASRNDPSGSGDADVDSDVGADRVRIGTHLVGGRHEMFGDRPVGSRTSATSEMATPNLPAPLGPMPTLTMIEVSLSGSLMW